MLAQKFFKLFPPPKFLDIPYAGLDISDEAVRCLEYSHTRRGLVIHRYGTRILPAGVIEGGEIRNKKVLQETIGLLTKELKVHVVKASLPEEKMYLFKTEVPSTVTEEIRQNVEFKLEENVPLSPAESLFFFDAIPLGGGKTVSVSVAPRNLVLSYLETINAAGVSVISFEVQPKAIARLLVPCGSVETSMMVNIGNHKTGIFVVCGDVVCFTSTIQWGAATMTNSQDVKNTFAELKRQIQQVHTYWSEHGQGDIDRVVFAGKAALTDGLLSECSAGFLNVKGQPLPFEVGKIWQNAFSYASYIPPIPYEESLDYVVAAGLGLPPAFCN